MQQEHQHKWNIIKFVELLSQDEVRDMKQQQPPLMYSSKETYVCCISCGEIKKLNDLK